MDFSLSHEQEDLLALAREFARKEIAPYVNDYDREERFPIEIIKQAADLGLMGGVVRPSTAAPDWTSRPTRWSSRRSPACATSSASR